MENPTAERSGVSKRDMEAEFVDVPVPAATGRRMDRAALLKRNAGSVKDGM